MDVSNHGGKLLAMDCINLVSNQTNRFVGQCIVQSDACCSLYVSSGRLNLLQTNCFVPVKYRMKYNQCFWQHHRLIRNPTTVVHCWQQPLFLIDYHHDWWTKATPNHSVPAFRPTMQINVPPTRVACDNALQSHHQSCDPTLRQNVLNKRSTKTYLFKKHIK